MLFRIEKGRTFVTNVFTRIFMWVIIMYIHTLYTMIKDYWTTSKKTKLLACPKDSFGTAGGLWQKNVLKCHLASSEENAKVKTKNENQTTKNAQHLWCNPKKVLFKERCFKGRFSNILILAFEVFMQPILYYIHLGQFIWRSTNVSTVFELVLLSCSYCNVFP